MSEEGGEVEPSRWIVVFLSFELRPMVLHVERIVIDDDDVVTLVQDGRTIRLYPWEVKAVRKVKEEHEQPSQEARDGRGEGGSRAS
jgi:hypothetical protein